MGMDSNMTACSGSDEKRQVAEELSGLGIAIGELSDIAEKVEVSLECVLRGGGDKTVAEKNTPEQDLVPLAHQIRSLRHHVEGRAGKLRGILARLEL